MIKKKASRSDALLVVDNLHKVLPGNLLKKDYRENGSYCLLIERTGLLQNLMLSFDDFDFASRAMNSAPTASRHAATKPSSPK